MATILQIIGAAAISVGLGLFSISFGLIAAGSFALLFGIAMDRTK